MANLDDLLGATSIAPKKDSFSWADAPVEAPVEDKPVAKKAAWGAVKATTAVSIKDQEKEAEKKGSNTKTADAPRAPAQPASSGSSYSYSSPSERRGDDNGSYSSDRPRGERWSANTGQRTGYGGDSRDGGDRGDYARGGGSRYGGDSGEGRRGGDSGGWGEGRSEGRMRYNPDVPSHGGSGGGRRYGESGEGGRGERREHAEVPFPTQAPYMLYLTGLPWEGTEQEVRDLLPGFWGEELEAKVKNVKVPIKDGKLRHAFIEFADADSLRAALENSGREFMGRTATCLVAEPHVGDRRGDKFGGSSSSGGSGWGERRSGFGSGFDRERPSRYDGPSERKPLNVAPRSVASDSTSSSTSSSSSTTPKSNPFGTATASTRDIYADKPKQTAAAPATAAAAAATAKPAESSVRSTRSDARPDARSDSRSTEQTESRADTRDWKAKNFQPSGNFRAASSASSNGKSSQQQGERRGGDRSRAPRDDTDNWKSTGGKPAPQRKPTSPAAATLTPSAGAADKGNIFDALSDE